MKWGVELVTPSQVVFIRVLFGFLPVLVFALLRGELKREHWKSAHHFCAMAILATALYYYGFAKGTSLLLSGIAGAISGAIPLFAFIASLIFLKDEKASFKRIVGIGLSFLGVFLLADPFSNSGGSMNLAGVGYMIMGSLSLGVSFVYARKFLATQNIPNAALTTYQLGAALILLFFVTDLRGAGELSSSTTALVGVSLGLGLLGTGVAYLAFYFLVKEWGAVSASSVTYIPPVVALVVGAFFVQEPIKMTDFIFAALILGGVVLIRSRPANANDDG